MIELNAITPPIDLQQLHHNPDPLQTKCKAQIHMMSVGVPYASLEPSAASE